MSFSEKLLKYGRNPSAHDIVKAVAILSMISDHSGLFLFGDDNWYRILGRVGGPLFFFAIGNSLNTNVTWRLFLWGLWLTGLSAFVLGSLHLNILLSFLLCRLLFQCWKPENASASLHALLLLLFLPLTIPTNSIFEYGTVGLNWAIAGRLVRTNSPLKTPWVIGGSLINFLWSTYHFDLLPHPEQMGLLAVESMALLSLMRFSKGEIPMTRAIGYPLMFLSRFSLEIYVYHLTFFLLFAAAFMN